MKTKLAACPILFLVLVLALVPILTVVCSAAPSEPLPEPSLSGTVRSALVLNLESGQYVYELDADRAVNPGPTTRLMLAAVLYGRLADSYSREVTVTDSAPGASGSIILPGDRLTVGDLFAALLIGGSDDAALALAVTAFGSDDAALAAMNARADELGMESTEYASIYGMHNSRSTTTARDAMRLAEHFYTIRPLCELASESYRYISISGNPVDIHNRSAFASTYYNTKYRRSDVESYAVGSTVEGGAGIVCGGVSDGLTYLTVLLGAPTAEIDEPNVYSTAGALIDYAYRGFGFVDLLEAGRIFGELPVSLSRVSDHVTYCIDEDLSLFCPRGTNTDLRVGYEVLLDASELVAPIEEGKRVGTLQVIFDGETVAELGLYTSCALPKSTALEFTDTVARVVRHPITITAICLAALGLLSLPFISAWRASSEEE